MKNLPDEIEQDGVVYTRLATGTPLEQDDKIYYDSRKPQMNSWSGKQLQDVSWPRHQSCREAISSEANYRRKKETTMDKGVTRVADYYRKKEPTMNEIEQDGITYTRLATGIKLEAEDKVLNIRGTLSDMSCRLDLVFVNAEGEAQHYRRKKEPTMKTKTNNKTEETVTITCELPVSAAEVYAGSVANPSPLGEACKAALDARPSKYKQWQARIDSPWQVYRDELRDKDEVQLNDNEMRLAIAAPDMIEVLVKLHSAAIYDSEIALIEKVLHKALPEAVAEEIIKNG